MTRSSVISVAAAVWLAACAQPAGLTPAELPRFDAAEHAPYLASGSARISGQAFLRQQGGGVVTCAGQRVLLFPDTSYVRAFMAAWMTGRSGPPVEPAEHGAAYRGMFRQSRCDAQGNFEFGGLPAGRYWIATEVQWMIGYVSQGGVLVAEASTDGARVIMSDESYRRRGSL